jgi:replicative DNA helicase
MGEHKTTAFLNTQAGLVMGMPTLLHCPVCNSTWDIVSLYAELNGLDDQKDFVRIVDALSNELGIRIDKSQIRVTPTQPAQSPKPAQSKPQKADYSGYLKECAAHIDGAADYLAKRGISLETARRYGLGYDAKTRRVVIPIGNGYTARAVFPCDKDYRYRKSPGLVSQGFALDQIKPGATVWICEGEFDALSIIEAGHHAIGLSGTGGIDAFFKYLGEHDMTDNPPRFFVALDDDEAGQKARLKCAQGLKAKGFSYALPPVWGADTKDANEALINQGLESFKIWLYDAESNFKDLKAIEAEQYRAQNVSGLLHEVFLRAQTAQPAISTGFWSLDEYLGGGLRPGLYVWGAIPSLGKTALVLQIAVHISESGRDVLYFSLEMPKDDLIWRSISRFTYLNDPQNALTQRDLQFHPIETQSEKRRDNALSAYERFYQSSKHMWIVESIGALSVDDIETHIAKHKELTGNSPVVVIDYLQILKPADPKMTDKAALDFNAMRLKQISNTYAAPILIISSFNRANYSTEAGFEAFKESGAVEYCADVLMALQLKDAIDAKRNAKGDATQAIKDATKQAKAADVRKIELVILKNRAGKITGDRGINFDYTPKYNNFTDADAAY